MISIGDPVCKRINYGMEGGAALDPVPGRVVYVHPSGRWYMAEFELPGGVVRESFMTAQLSDSDKPLAYEPLYSQTVQREQPRKYVETIGLSPNYLKR